MDNKVCVVISVYSATPTQYELISFQQCFKILNKHPIYVISPEGLDLKEYKKLVPNFNIMYIDKKWQASKLNYNKFKLSQFFYKLFEKYTYLLTYELDAFIFKDELLYWCDKGYDYIGAPWFDGFDMPNTKLIGVGNSGFSLRRITAIQDGIKRVYYVDSSKYKSLKNNKYLDHLKNIIYSNLNRIASFRSSLFNENENTSIQNASFLFEDRIIADLIAKSVKKFKLAPIEDAMKFSIEANPAMLFKINDNELPMGCHAWWQYDVHFWKPYIESHGYRL